VKLWREDGVVTLRVHSVCCDKVVEGRDVGLGWADSRRSWGLAEQEI
jgi:hypothetical protein